MLSCTKPSFRHALPSYTLASGKQAKKQATLTAYYSHVVAKVVGIPLRVQLDLLLQAGQVRPHGAGLAPNGEGYNVEWKCGEVRPHEGGGE